MSVEWSEFHTNLRETLAGLFYSRELSLPVLRDAGLPIPRIQLSDVAITLWQSAIEVAMRHGRLASLIDAALAHAPGDPSLLEAKHRKVERLRGPDIATDVAWRAPVAEDTLEKIIGPESQLMPVAFLAEGMRCARAVCRIRRADQRVGTGFLIAGDLLVTNHHVLPDANIATRAIAEFNWERGFDGLESAKVSFALDPTVAFWTTAADDLTVVKVQSDLAGGRSAVAEYGAIAVSDRTVKVGDRVSIIQHAGGEPKQVALHRNITVFVDASRIQYLTDTLGGSSGSPVFDAQWRLVAIHHAGGRLREPGSKVSYYRNEGIAVAMLRNGVAAAGLG